MTVDRPQLEDPDVETCYRHPDRPTRVRCTRCNRPICTEDMIEAPVGFLCPEDAKQPARVRRVAARTSGNPTVTTTLLVVIAGMFLLSLADAAVQGRLILVPALVGAGEWWRLLTSGFLHGGLIHIAFNAYLLYLLGRMLEPTLGSVAFSGIYLAGLAGGSLGAVLLSNPFQGTLGASGAVFGLMGAAMVGLHRRGIDPWRSDIGSLVILNLVLTFVIPRISIGGHLGGLAGGAAAGLIVLMLRDRRQPGLAGVAAGAFGILLLVGGIVVANLRV